MPAPAGGEDEDDLRNVIIAESSFADTDGVGLYVDGYVTGVAVTYDTDHRADVRRVGSLRCLNAPRALGPARQVVWIHAETWSRALLMGMAKPTFDACT